MAAAQAQTVIDRHARRGWAGEYFADPEHARVLTSCLFCRESFDGTLAEGRAWHEAHRRFAHPEIRPLARPKHRGFRLTRREAQPEGPD